MPAPSNGLLVPLGKERGSCRGGVAGKRGAGGPGFRHEYLDFPQQLPRRSIGRTIRAAGRRSGTVREAQQNSPSMLQFASRAILTDSRQPITSGGNSTYFKPEVNLSQAPCD
jgi:hypothetical protein